MPVFKTILSTLQFHPLKTDIPGKVLRSFRRDAGWSEQPLRCATNQNVNSKVQWVSVVSNEMVIAIARLELAPPGFCYVSELIVQQEYRRRGIGRWFLQNIEQYAALFGIPRLLLHAAPLAAGFYERLHFAPDPVVPGFLRKEISPLQPRASRAFSRPLANSATGQAR